jgi:hypothetical protein
MQGAGTASNPYQVVNASQLLCMNQAAVGTEFKLMNDINIATSGVTVTPIAGFKGNFNGNGRTISGFEYFNALDDQVGLFDEFTTAVTIQNLTLSNFKVEGRDDVGALVGKINTPNGSTATLNQITFLTPVVSGNHRVAILAGSAERVLINSLVINKAALVGVSNIGMATGVSTAGFTLNSGQVDGVVSGSFYMGGLVGSLTGGVIDRVAVYANISVDANTAQLTANSMTFQQEIGGILGNVTSSAITRYYFLGTLNSTHNSSLYRSAGSIAGKSTASSFTEGYGGARSMTQNPAPGANVNGFVGDLVGGDNAFGQSYYMYSNLALPAASGNTPTVTTITANNANLQAVQTQFAEFDFNGTWKIPNLPFRLPVLWFQDSTTPFMSSAYNYTPTFSIIMTEPEDPIGNLFPNRTELQSSTQKTITFSSLLPAPITIKSVTTALGKSFVVSGGSCLTLDGVQNGTLSASNGVTAQPCQIVVDFLPDTDVSAVLNDLLIVEYEYTSALDGPIRAKLGHKLDGFGTTAKANLTNTSIQFNSVPSATNSDLQTLTITNNGLEDLTISGYELGTDFNQTFTADTTSCGTGTLAPSTSCTISLTFAPGSPGAFTNTMKVNYSGSIYTNSRSVTYTLSGTGL